MKREQEFADGFIEDLDSIEQEASKNMPKVIDVEPIFSSNINDFKKDDSVIKSASPEELDNTTTIEEKNTTNE